MTMRAADVLDVIAALESAAIHVWIDGGWGVDALLHEQTREHDDLDIVASADDVPRLVVVLADLGYREIRTWPDSPEVFVLRAGDVHPVQFDAEGNGIQKIDGGKEAVYPADGLTGTGVIGDHPVRCLTPELQVRSHTGYELKDSDAHDMRALLDRFGVALLPEQQGLLA